MAKWLWKFFCNPRKVDKVVDYIKNQKNIIEQKVFKKSFAILKNYEIEFDEKYIWD